MLSDEVRGCAGDLVHGLADDLEVSNNGILNLPVGSKGLKVRYRLKVACHSVNRFGNVFQIVFDTLRMLHPKTGDSEIG